MHHSFLFTSCFSAYFFSSYALSISTDDDDDELSVPAIRCHAWLTFKFIGLMYWYVNCVLYGAGLGQGTLWRGWGGTCLSEVSHTLPPFVSPPFPPPSFLAAKHPVLLSYGKESEEAPGLQLKPTTGVCFFFFLFMVITAHTKSLKEDFWDVKISWMQMMYILWWKGSERMCGAFWDLIVQATGS